MHKYNLWKTQQVLTYAESYGCILIKRKKKKAWIFKLKKKQNSKLANNSSNCKSELVKTW